jgi:hypothetical protein
MGQNGMEAIARMFEMAREKGIINNSPNLEYSS